MNVFNFDLSNLLAEQEAEREMETLPYEIIVDDVIYEYGDYYYRVKGFRANTTGKYKIYHDKCPIEGKKLEYTNPFRQLIFENLACVRELEFERYFPTNAKNFSFPNLENIDILNSERKYIYNEGCLFEIDNQETRLTITYTSQVDMEEVKVPHGFRCLSIFSEFELPKLKRICLPNDVRLIENVNLNSKDIILKVDNVQKNVMILEKAKQYQYEYTQIANPIVDFVQGGLECTIINDGQVSVAASAGCECIPEMIEYNGKKFLVTAISDFGLKDLEIRELIIPKGITKLGFGACYSLTDLQSIYFGGDLEIDDFAFSKCDNLRSVISYSQYGRINIGRNAFSGCEFLEEIVIPNKIGTIKSFAFYGCKCLQNITFPEQIEKIEDDAFYYLERITFTGSIPKMTSSAFTIVKNIYFLNIGNGKLLCDIFGERAIRWGSSIECEYVVIPDGVTHLYKNSMLWSKTYNNQHFHHEENTNLKYIYLPKSIEEIEDETFFKCENLEGIFINNKNFRSWRNILFRLNTQGKEHELLWVFQQAQWQEFEIDDSIERIGKRTFANTGIRRISLHKNKLYIDEGAFENSSITQITLHPQTELFDRKVFLGSCSLKKITDQNGKVYDMNLVDSYIAKLKNMMDLVDKKMVNIPVGCTNKKIILNNYFFALVELACENMIMGANQFERQYPGKDKMYVCDLFAYEQDIEELLATNITAPSSQYMTDFVKKCQKWMISKHNYKESHFSSKDISGCYSIVLEHNNVTACTSDHQLPALKFN